MDKHPIKIVGIGTSAGGLTALEDFFSNIPSTSDIAFVVVQHLDPNHKCMMSELLQRVTTVPVSQIENKTLKEPNHVYIIPPNKDLFILKGRLNLKAQTKSLGLKLPIDSFFKSLAEDMKENAIGIVLSGMGSDGTLGLQEIKKNGGLTLAQAPQTAKFDSMPLSAINAHSTDIVASTKELGQNILVYSNAPRTSLNNTLPSLSSVSSSSAMDAIFQLLLKRSGNDFSFYKPTTLCRRIERRLIVHKMKSLEEYHEYLSKNAQELDLLFNELLIGVTGFFRDPDVWEIIINKTLPDLIANHPMDKHLRAWVTACSSGEEAYTLAIAFQECLKFLGDKNGATLQIFATDLDSEAIKVARDGIYPKQIAESISSVRLSNYFETDNKGYRISKKIREMVVFAPQNIIVDPPFTKLDILTCRNLLIYFNTKLQNKIIPLFHYALNPSGILLLGTAETIGEFSSLFKKSSSKSSIYHRINTSTQHADLDFPARVFPIVSNNKTITVKNMNNKTENLQSLANEALLLDFAPAAVLVNADGDILYINGRTGKYLEPAAGKANWNIYAMARDGLRYEIDMGIKKALKQNDIVSFVGHITKSEGSEQSVLIRVKEIKQPEGLAGTIMITFEQMAPVQKNDHKTTTLKDDTLLNELSQAREQVQLMREEMKHSQEELKAANEELQSTNEELQSANEELTTSKEEMQSLNEELQTLNFELQSKVDDLTWVNNDMTNLLNSTEIATIFLDNKLNVRRFTTLSAQLFKLIDSDVGRPLSDVVSSLKYDTLQYDAKEVLRTLIFHETQAITANKRWFKVRIMPYRTQENMIDGVVITFTDISQLKSLEVELEKRELSDDRKTN
ncbi:chemotaxis protein CheB [Brumicola nitratireducens]|uniref:protein-glutamate O-methyltransferase n=1 Tax=Glaciecola nitratireducens (strain JCM 12485 / KCTC 12276 / FR1064) TaxID=1085623 RepID=G4QHG5_GLANF|nr:chemotaxis protein CheB [Glaciecola nitratireducens]AEP29951.1 MCP methyltransferase, CheR-type [Glaciecola nitratireducens FR1064]